MLTLVAYQTIGGLLDFNMPAPDASFICVEGLNVFFGLLTIISSTVLLGLGCDR